MHHHGVIVNDQNFPSSKNRREIVNFGSEIGTLKSVMVNVHECVVFSFSHGL